MKGGGYYGVFSNNNINTYYYPNSHNKKITAQSE